LTRPADSEKDVFEGAASAQNARGVEFFKKQGRYILYEIQSGNYEFTAKNI
jgi:hypothetical protein